MVNDKSKLTFVKESLTFHDGSNVVTLLKIKTQLRQISPRILVEPTLRLLWFRKSFVRTARGAAIHRCSLTDLRSDCDWSQIARGGACLHSNRHKLIGI